MSTSRVLICEGDAEISRCLEGAIKSLGYSVQIARDGDHALSFIQRSEAEISALLLGEVVLNRGALDFLKEVRAINARLPVIVVAGMWSARDVVAAMNSGVTDFISKPIVYEEVARVLTTAVAPDGDARKCATRNGVSPWAFRSTNPRIRTIESLLGKAGQSGAPVLIQGETGSGKEVLARKLHNESSRARRPFLKLNCAALPSELVESELFGYERGAFTGAFEKKAGIFELADGGTILLDEIGDMDIRLQAKLLQVLQDQEFRRIGGKETVRVNVRILAATHRDLENAVHERAFREDLYYRLNVIVFQVPPLRERTEDIVPLGEFLIRKHADQGCLMPTISTDLGQAMMAYKWPGNVRELENCMRKLVIFRDADAIARDLRTRILRKSSSSARPADLQVVKTETRDDMPILEQVTKVNRRAETDAILAALHATRWNRKQAAAILGIDYKSLLYKMKKLGMDDKPTPLSELPCPPLTRVANGS
jgi:two-component system, NtrC family, response regulator AtoC